MKKEAIGLSLQALAEQGVPAELDLWPRIEAQIRETPTFSPSHARTWVTVALATTILIILALPPVRSWAKEVLRQIGYIVLTDEKTASQQIVEMESAITPIPRVPQRLSLEEATEQAGFPAYVAAYAPAGYELLERIVDIDERGTSIETRYFDRESHSYQIVQAYLKDGHWYEPPSVEERREMTVRGQAAIWLEVKYTEDSGLNTLAWKESSFIFAINSNVLSLEEIINIAESLSPSVESQVELSETGAQILGPDVKESLSDSLVHVYQPSYVPDGYQLFFVAGEPDGGGIQSYGKSDPSNPVGAYLTIQQGPTERRFAEYAMGESPVIEVQVRGGTGLWVEAPTGLAQVDGESQAYNEKYLFWEEDGLTFMMISNALSQAEMLKIAESLAY